MEVLVQRRFDPNGPIGLKVYEKEYHMLSPTGEIILPETWDRLIKPGWVVEMRLWSSAENKQKSQESRNYLGLSTSGSTTLRSIPPSSIKPPVSPSGVSSASSVTSSNRRRLSSVRSWFRGRKPNRYEDSD